MPTSSVRKCASIPLCYSFRGQRDILSFPTRRSSDLGRQPHLAGKLQPALERLRQRGRRGAQGLQDLFGGFYADLHRRRDRKSTRLNSSHSQISYAVFCLKKKHNTSPNGASRISTTSA